MQNRWLKMPLQRYSRHSQTDATLRASGVPIAPTNILTTACEPTLL
jgi:hypothetical protein